jgi:hypothetical protein
MRSTLTFVGSCLSEKTLGFRRHRSKIAYRQTSSLHDRLQPRSTMFKCRLAVHPTNNKMQSRLACIFIRHFQRLSHFSSSSSSDFLNDRTSLIGLKDSIVLATCVPVPDQNHLQSSRELYSYEGIYYLRSDRSRTFAFAKHKPRQATRRVDTR